ncbi:hypothetical protein HDU76_004435 [Blyttiomyces sp. JEL0837]|nr:hypothetical protein HDU76_004435 [Blyttiomyces sp. JEL0837]
MRIEFKSTTTIILTILATLFTTTVNSAPTPAHIEIPGDEVPPAPTSTITVYTSTGTQSAPLTTATETTTTSQGLSWVWSKSRRAMLSSLSPTSSSSASTPHRSYSLWDTLPSEIKNNILNQCDLVTRFLNDDLTHDFITKHGSEILKVLFKENLVDVDLNLLPQSSFPTTKTGLLLVTSKEMYHKLCILKHNLVDPKPLKEYLETDHLWAWLDNENNYHSKMRTISFLSSSCHQLLVNIPLYHMWIDEFPDWWNDMEDIKKFVMACDIGHTNLARSLITDIQNHVQYSVAFNYGFERVCLNEHLESVKLLLSYSSEDDIRLITSQIAIALDATHHEPQLELAELLVGSDILRNAKDEINQMLIDCLYTEQTEIIPVYFSLKNRPFLISYYFVYRILNFLLENGDDHYDEDIVRFILTFDEVYGSDPTDFGYEKLIETLGRVPLHQEDLDYAIQYWIDRGRSEIVDCLRVVRDNAHGSLLSEPMNILPYFQNNAFAGPIQTGENKQKYELFLSTYAEKSDTEEGTKFPACVYQLQQQPQKDMILSQVDHVSTSTSCRSGTYHYYHCQQKQKQQNHQDELWDTLPVEIKNNIFEKCDLVTRYLNDDLTPDIISKLGTDLWNIAFEENLVDADLGLLPQSSFPTTTTDLLLVNSKQMYHKLCKLKPNLSNPSPLKQYLEKYQLEE